MNKEYVLNKLIKFIKARALEYQNSQNKEAINKEHYRKLLKGLLEIIEELEE